MASSNDLDVVRQAVDAFNQGRPSDLLALVAIDAEFIIPGKSPISGIYRGREQIAAFFGKIATLAGGTQRVEVLHVLTGGNDTLVVIWRVTAHRNDQDFDGLAGFIFSMRDGQIVKAHNLQANQDAVDAFWLS